MLRYTPLLAALGPLAVLGAALFSQYVGGLNPCPLCIWQRWPHGVAGGLGLAALALGARWAWLHLAQAPVLLAGAGIAGFHVGVEQGWWEGLSTCSGGDVGGLSTAEAVERIFNAPLVRCDEVAWAFAGVSMAGWNLILSVALAALAVAAWRQASSSASQ